MLEADVDVDLRLLEHYDENVMVKSKYYVIIGFDKTELMEAKKYLVELVREIGVSEGEDDVV